MSKKISIKFNYNPESMQFFNYKVIKDPKSKNINYNLFIKEKNLYTKLVNIKSTFLEPFINILYNKVINYSVTFRRNKFNIGKFLTNFYLL